jgi:hypothetical protein
MPKLDRHRTTCANGSIRKAITRQSLMLMLMAITRQSLWLSHGYPYGYPMAITRQSLMLMLLVAKASLKTSRHDLIWTW